LFEEQFKGGFIWSGGRRKSIDEICGRKKSFIPIFLRERGRGKKGEASFYNVAVFSFHRAILVMGVRTG
jgi:hypothetical protein